MQDLKNPDGFPTTDNFYSSGSEVTAKNRIPTPPGLHSFIQGPVVHINQNPSDAPFVGTRGTTYLPDQEDQIFTTIGGHAIIWGNKPGHETLRIQSGKGAAVEFSSDGSIKIASAKGLQIAVNGDGELVISGDYTIVATGDMKFKAPKIIFDTNEMVTNIRGDKSEYIEGDNQVEIKGNKSETVAGNGVQIVNKIYRISTGNDFRVQTSGNYINEVGGDYSNLTGGTQYNGAGGNTFIISNMSLYVSTKAQTDFVSKTGTNISSEAGISVVSKGNTSITSTESSVNISAPDFIQGAAATVNFKANTEFSVDCMDLDLRAEAGNMSIFSSGLAYFNATSIIDLYSPEVHLNTNEIDPSNTPVELDAMAQYSITYPARLPEVAPAIVVNDTLTDFDYTDGSIDNILNAEQIEFTFIEAGQSENIPQKVLDRMAQKGIIYDPVKKELISQINTDKLNLGT